MKIKGLLDEDFTNYKKCSTFIIFPNCSFKCDIENGSQFCQNWSLHKQPNLDVSVSTIVNHYINNPIPRAIIYGGLEPFDSWDDLFELTKALREKTNDDIVIYTGYTEEEVIDKIEIIKQFPNIIIKFGRFRPNQKPHYDEILGINLISDNQYAKQIS